MSYRRSLVFATALALALGGAVDAQARAGSGGSFGSRGSKSFNNVPSTPTAPSVSPFNARPNYNSPNGGLLRPNPAARSGMFGGAFTKGLLGGLLGAGLFGMLFGNGFMSGIGGLLSFVGLLMQIGLIALVVMLAVRFFRSRSSLAGAGAPAGGGGASFRSGPGPVPGGPAQMGPGAGFGGAAHGGAAPGAEPVTLDKADFDAFEQSLAAVQAAYAKEDVATLRRLAAPDVANAFVSELEANRARGVVNRVSEVRLVQGDLAESWREGGAEYATVAMRFSLVDVTLDRASGRVVAGDPNRPQLVTEAWTFSRPAGGGPSAWRLSAIQQAG